MIGLKRVGLVWLGAVGFAVGAAMHIVAVTFALLSNLGEMLLFVLTPGGLLTREVGLSSADWPGLVNVGLAMIANGLIYAFALTLLVTAWQKLRGPSLSD